MAGRRRHNEKEGGPSSIPPFPSCVHFISFLLFSITDLFLLKFSLLYKLRLLDVAFVQVVRVYRSLCQLVPLICAAFFLPFVYSRRLFTLIKVSSFMLFHLCFLIYALSPLSSVSFVIGFLCHWFPLLLVFLCHRFPLLLVSFDIRFLIG